MAIVNGSLNVFMNLIHEIKLGTSTGLQIFDPITYAVTEGTTAGKMDLLWSSKRTLSASASEEIDLRGDLVDLLGQTCVFVDVRMICIVAASTNTNAVLVGGAAANAFINWVGDASDIVSVRKGGCLFLYNPNDPGYAVTAGTGDLLKIANSGAGTAVTYDIYIGGVSA